MLQLLVLSLHGFGLYTEEDIQYVFQQCVCLSLFSSSWTRGYKPLEDRVPPGGKAAQQPDMMAYALTLLEKA